MCLKGTFNQSGVYQRDAAAVKLTIRELEGLLILLLRRPAAIYPTLIITMTIHRGLLILLLLKLTIQNSPPNMMTGYKT
jgi:hypothetical protein